MSDTNEDPRLQADPAARNKPAIGLAATTDGNAIAAAILRARRHDHHVFVLVEDREGSEAARFAEELGATIVTSASRTADGDPVEHLQSEVRQKGFPGVIYHDDPTKRIDYDRSTETLQSSEDYLIRAQVRPTVEDYSGVIVGIPAHNEAVAIGSVVLSAKRYSDEVIVVNDGSTDDTVRLAEEAGATVIEHEENRGKGAAIRTLLDYVNPEQCDAVVLLDGDGQHVPDDIPQVVHPVLDDGADFVIGSRYLDGTEDETPRHRRFGQRVLDLSTNFLNLLTNGRSRPRVSDFQSGFRALSRTVVEQDSVRNDVDVMGVSQ